MLKCYVGDKTADASWTSSYLNKDAGGLVDRSAFDVLGTEGARPFEVATVRLQNMIKVSWLVSWLEICVFVCCGR